PGGAGPARDDEHPARRRAEDPRGRDDRVPRGGLAGLLDASAGQLTDARPDTARGVRGRAPADRGAAPVAPGDLGVGEIRRRRETATGDSEPAAVVRPRALVRRPSAGVVVPQKPGSAGSGPIRPSARSRPSIFSICSSVSRRSAAAKFETIRSGVTVFGITTLPIARCQAMITWPASAPCASAISVITG